MLQDAYTEGRLWVLTPFLNQVHVRTRQAGLHTWPLAHGTPFGAQPGGVLCSSSLTSDRLLQRGGASSASLPSDAIPWSGGMGHNNLMVLYGRPGLVLAIGLIMAIIAAPLLQRVWSPDVVIAQR